MADALSGRATIPEVIHQLDAGLYLLPTVANSEALKEYAETKLLNNPFAFDDLNEALEAEGFDWLIYDLSPGLSPLERCSLLSVDEVITPVLAEYFSIDGLESFVSGLKQINKVYRRNIKHSRLVVNGLNVSFARHRSALPHLKKLGFEVYILGQNSYIPKSQYEHISLYKKAKQSARTVLLEFERLASDLIASNDASNRGKAVLAQPMGLS